MHHHRCSSSSTPPSILPSTPCHAALVVTQPAMSGVTLQRLSTLTLNLKQLNRLPRLLLDLSPPSLPSPSPTVAVSQVPRLFQEPFILSGYRPVGQDWRCYLLSLFQRHNESLNVWTHLLAGPVLLLRWWVYMGAAAGHTLDVTSLPLCLYVLSSLTYLLCSVVAHLWQSHSELSHYSLFFLDYVGVAVYQYGCSLGHYFYAAEPAWRESGIRALYLPGAAFLAWLSCYSCCYAKSRYQRPYPVSRKICQVIPTSMAYVLDISPVVHRLVSVPWAREPAMPFHALQVAFFLSAAFFFSCPVPECFLPGRCDFVGQGHQIFHLLLSLCTLSQLEALLQDHTRQRDTVVEVFGERQLWWACVSFPVLVLCCSLTALLMRRHIQRRLQVKTE